MKEKIKNKNKNAVILSKNESSHIRDDLLYAKH